MKILEKFFATAQPRNRAISGNPFVVPTPPVAFVPSSRREKFPQTSTAPIFCSRKMLPTALRGPVGDFVCEAGCMVYWLMRFTRREPPSGPGSGWRRLLALVHVDFKGNQLLFIVELGIWNRGEVDVTHLSIGFAKILQSRRDLFTTEDVTVVDREKATHCGNVCHQFVVFERDPIQAILQALVHMKTKRDVAISGAAGQRSFLAVDLHLEVSMILPSGSHSFHRVVGHSVRRVSVVLPLYRISDLVLVRDRQLKGAREGYLGD